MTRKLIAATVLVAAMACASDGPKHPVTVRVVENAGERGTEQDELWFQPMRISYFTFKVEAGEPPSKGNVLNCEQKTEFRFHEKDGVRFQYPVVLLHCGERIFVLTGVSF